MTSAAQSELSSMLVFRIAAQGELSSALSAECSEYSLLGLLEQTPYSLVCARAQLRLCVQILAFNGNAQTGVTTGPAIQY